MMKNVYKTQNSRLNATAFNKGIMIQQTQRNSIINSSITVLKRSKSRQQQKQQPIVTVKQNLTSAKLPKIVKKSASINKSKLIPSACIENSSIKSSPVPSSTVINEPLPPKLLKPIIVQPRLPSIKDHTIKENLTLKATLKCKSPPPGSLFSRSNTFVVNVAEEQTKTRRPLQHMDVGSLLSESARHRLKRLFKKLDTDKDGHLLYSQVEKCFPSTLPRAQLTFFHVLYDIISDTTYFGLQEFYATAIIVEMVAKQDSTLWNTFLDDVDFNYYHKNILELLEEFNNHCLSNTGTINYENFLELIMKRTINDKIERITKQLEYIMPKIKIMKINRLDFIALLPAIIYIQSCFDRERTLFRFRENSILDLHMRQALLT